jgi:hypothetical protein
VAVAARAATAQVLLVVMVLWAGTMRVMLSPLVRSYGGISAAGVQEPDEEEPNGEEPCVE